MSSENKDKYEAVIGLEVHAQLKTNSKAFSSDANEYGAPPNSLVSPVTLGHPGTLPRLNEKSVEFGIKLGLACHSNITKYNEFSRKNYFYADLPKGYQITQFDTPICTGGYVEIRLSDGTEKKIGLTRIHIEEDSGKSIHDIDPFNTLIDLNRAGVPLLEIVSEPHIRSGEEAYQYLTEIRKLVRYLEICDGNMEEGSLRCDANISVRIKGSQKFGQKVEVKNMNSIRNVRRAIEHEIDRQISVLESGGEIIHETRTFNAASGTTTVMRSKEEANDYRYFPEPDLQPLVITDAYIEEVKQTLPPLPNELFRKFVSTYGLSEYDASNLTNSKDICLFYEDVVRLHANYKSAANLVMGEVKSYLNKNALPIADFPLSAEHIAGMLKLIDEGKLSYSTASQKLFPAMIRNPEKDVHVLAEEMDLLQEDNQDALTAIVEDVLQNHPKEFERIKNGEMKLIGFFMGQIMKASRGKADPKKTKEILMQKIKN